MNQAANQDGAGNQAQGRGGRGRGQARGRGRGRGRGRDQERRAAAQAAVDAQTNRALDALQQQVQHVVRPPPMPPFALYCQHRMREDVYITTADLRQEWRQLEAPQLDEYLQQADAINRAYEDSIIEFRRLQ
ncbi:hypothetical protein BC940DRAFT_321429 [Gongronella butleri]|nr:hypothetical protein BC940DRAFT_321429 [Gongronella butleri]